MSEPRGLGEVLGEALDRWARGLCVECGEIPVHKQATGGGITCGSCRWKRIRGHKVEFVAPDLGGLVCADDEAVVNPLDSIDRTC